MLQGQIASHLREGRWWKLAADVVHPGHQSRPFSSFGTLWKKDKSVRLSSRFGDYGGIWFTVHSRLGLNPLLMTRHVTKITAKQSRRCNSYIQINATEWRMNCSWNMARFTSVEYICKMIDICRCTCRMKGQLHFGLTGKTCSWSDNRMFFDPSGVSDRLLQRPDGADRSAVFQAQHQGLLRGRLRLLRLHVLQPRERAQLRWVSASVINFPVRRASACGIGASLQ